ncbi:MAG: alpha/beta hydrolase [Pseudomonadota bacterium]
MAETQAEMDAVMAMLSQMLEANGGEPSIEAMRAGYTAMGLSMPLADGAACEDIVLGGVPGLKITPAQVQGGRTLLYFHGGGYVMGSAQGHRSMVSQMATRMGAIAYSMEYRLAPEAPFPAATEDGLAAYRGLLDAGVPSADIVISGDSAGGGLTLATALCIKGAGLPMPAGLVPISPWVNVANTGWAYEAIGDRDPMATKEGLDMMSGLYRNGASASDPLISPIHGDLSGLPPMLIQVGSEERLLSDSTTLAERAGAAGVAVQLEIWPGMVHVFHFFHTALSDAHRAMDGMAAWADGKWVSQSVG